MAGLYIHIPFCKQKCTYCDFASFPKEIGKAESYFACLYREIEARGRELKDKTFDTIYIGGGTPSFVESKFIVGAIRQVKKFFKFESQKCRCNEMICKCPPPKIELVNKKPIEASDEEIKENPPSRSAKLRIARCIS